MLGALLGAKLFANLSGTKLFLIGLGLSFLGVRMSTATWVPVVNFNNSPTGVTYAAGGQGGNWVRFQFGSIDIAWLKWDAQLANKGSGTGSGNGGQFSITGFPFTTLNDSGSGSFFAIALSNMVTVAGTQFYQAGMPSNSSTIGIARMTDIAGTLTEVFLAWNDCNNNSYMKGSGIVILAV